MSLSDAVILKPSNNSSVLGYKLLMDPLRQASLELKMNLLSVWLITNLVTTSASALVHVQYLHRACYYTTALVWDHFSAFFISSFQWDAHRECAVHPPSIFGQFRQIQPDYITLLSEVVPALTRQFVLKCVYCECDNHPLSYFFLLWLFILCSSAAEHLSPLFLGLDPPWITCVRVT